MTPICAWLLCLCGLYLLAPTLGQLTRITSVERKQSTDGSNFILTVNFKADSKPEAEWFLQAYGGSKQPLPGTITYDSSTYTGSTTLTMVKDPNVSPTLNLGEMGVHYMELNWNLYDQTDKTMNINLRTAYFRPRGDIPYNKGEVKWVTVKVPYGRGSGVNFFSDDVRWVGEYINTTTGEIDVTETDNFFMQTHVQFIDGLTVSDVKFDTRKYTLNGYYSASLLGSVDDNQPLYGVTERFHFKIHESSNGGPFPDDFTKAQFLYVNSSGSVDCDYMCHLLCRANGNDIKTVEMFKAGANGQRTKITAAKLQKRNPYSFTLELQLDAYNEDVSGDYFCVATQNNNLKDEDKIAVIDKNP